MSKAILVMDMPENCIDCPCSFLKEAKPKLNLICGQTQEDVNGGGKPEWCPLKPIPEHKEEKHTSEYEDIKNEGFNACLDMILDI